MPDVTREFVCTSVRRDKEPGKFQIQLVSCGDWMTPNMVQFLADQHEGWKLGDRLTLAGMTDKQPPVKRLPVTTVWTASQDKQSRGAWQVVMQDMSGKFLPGCAMFYGETAPEEAVAYAIRKNQEHQERVE